MKKLLIILCALILTGCAPAKRTPGDVAGTSFSSEVAESTVTEETAEPSDTAEASGSVSSNAVDIDLTLMSSTMVYSQVYCMTLSPGDYIGMTVKMRGIYSYYHDSDNDVDYFACIVQDATACCASGIEFELTDDYVFPYDYPANEDEICVVGRFDAYTEGEYTYCILRDAEIVRES